MTVSDLKALLDDLVETYGEEWADETDCRIAYQPNYPLVTGIKGVTAVSPAEAAAYCEDPEEAEEEVDEACDSDRPTEVVLCANSGDDGYGDRWWWAAAQN